MPVKWGWFCGISELRIHFWCISARGFEVADNFPVKFMLRGVLFHWKQTHTLSGFDFPNFWKSASKIVLLVVVDLLIICEGFKGHPNPWKKLENFFIVFDSLLVCGCKQNYFNYFSKDRKQCKSFTSPFSHHLLKKWYI